jgi:hypothetical protein
MRHVALLPSLLLLVSAGVSQAAEGSFWEIRADLGMVPGLSESKGTDEGGSWTDKLEDKPGFMFAPGVVWGTPFGDQGMGIIVGGSLVYRTGGGEINETDNKVDLDMSSLGLLLVCGPTYQVDAWNFQLAPHLGFGTSSFEAKYSGVDDDGAYSGTSKGDGSYVNYGITVRGTYAFNKQISAGLVVGYDSFEADVKSDGEDSEKLTASGDGLILALTAGWKL